MKLILGSAGFVQPYGEGVTSPPSLNEIIEMLRLARYNDIEVIDTAVAYNCEDILRIYAKDFYIINKAREFTLWGDELLYHYKQEEEPISNPEVYTGASIYKPNQMNGEESTIQVPFNIQNLSFEPYLYLRRPKIIVRNVFNRGLLLKDYSVKDCLNFVKQFDRIWGVVIGPNSVKELEQILEVW